VGASAWQTSDGYRDGSARRREQARVIPANDNAVAERKQASEKVGHAHSSLSVPVLSHATCETLAARRLRMRGHLTYDTCAVVQCECGRVCA
jgi:hypothetical protein